MLKKQGQVDLINPKTRQVKGPVASRFNEHGQLNIGGMRPYMAFNSNGEYVGSFMNVYIGGDPKKKSSYREVPFNANATLRRDEWKALDEVILDIKRYRLGGVQDLIDRGLTYTLGNAMGTTVMEWHDVDDPGEAEVTMDAISRTKNFRPDFGHNYLPIPIIHADYQIKMRELATSRNLGNGIDTINAEKAARRVYEKRENMLFTDTTYAFGELDSRNRNKIYSYLNHPDRNTFTISTAWDTSGISATAIKNDVKNMKQTALNNRMYGPYMIYVSSNYEVVLDDDYNVSGASIKTIRQRIMEIGGILDIKVVDTLPDDTVLLVQMTSDVVRLVQGMGLQNVEWESEGGMVTNFKVMLIEVPQLRTDQAGHSGIVHGSV